jgi:hypothetical protein
MNAHARNAARFPIGRTHITPAAQAALDTAGVPGLLVLARHVRGDWGELPVEDLAANELALLTGNRLLSSYTLPGDRKVRVITEADRSSTTILLPDEY